MADFVIIPDSASDMTAPLRERFGIPECRMGTVTYPNGESKEVDLDWETMTPDEFYGLMKNKSVEFKSSTPIMAKEVEIYKKYLAKGLDIISVSLSSALSGTYSASVLAAKTALEEYPERKIICVDSLRYSTSLTLLIALAAEQKKQGKTIEEVADWMNANKNRIHQMGPMDDLYFLAHKGRISNFKAFFGTMAGVNPMADFNKQGLSEVLVKCKGKAMAFDVSIEYIKKTIEDPHDQIIFVAHSARKAFAEKYAELIQKEIGPKEIILTEVGMSCGINIGPGLCAAFYYGSEISDNLETEKEYMRQILENYKKK
jgi:DegV family protein with EDD domain